MTIQPAAATSALFARQRPSRVVGVLAALVGVGVATAAIYPLSDLAPVVSLSVVYLPAVLFMSAVWGLLLGLITSLLSAAAFNFFHLPPVGQFTIADPRNWVALAAFTTVAAVASWMAEIARTRTLEAQRRRAEADLAAALARELLAGADTSHALAAAAHRLAAALGLGSVAIEAGATDGDGRRRALALRDADRDQIATLLVGRELPDETVRRLSAQVVPSLEALVAVALRRDAAAAEAVETAALRRSDEVKTALLRAVSHDLRSPLTTIVAAGHALSSQSLPAEDRVELSSAVVTEGERLASLVDKLLDLSKLQAGSAPPRREWLSIEEVVLAALESLHGVTLADARAAGPEPARAVGPEPPVRLNLAPGLPDVRADAAQLERAFANLIENAIRYAGEKPVSINAMVVSGRLVVSVIDQGPGIAITDLERIFEPFYRGRRADAHTEDRWTGSGLGLAIAKGFIEGNGGTISAQSLPGQGTSFVISLPIESRTQAPAVR